MRIYAIGDIHGQIGLLRNAHRLIEADGGAAARVVHLGDLVDRGPDSRGVIEFLMQGQAAGRDWIVLKGNHDRLFHRFLSDPDWIDGRLSDPVSWVRHPGLGAGPTLLSYGVDPDLSPDHLSAAIRDAVPRGHADWLAGLPAWHLDVQALFVHAGLRAGVDLQDQAEDDLLWIRNEFYDSDADFGPLIVHGHTPLRQVGHYRWRVNIDTGAAFGRTLSTIVIEDGDIHLLTEAGRQPVRPEVS